MSLVKFIEVITRVKIEHHVSLIKNRLVRENKPLSTYNKKLKTLKETYTYKTHVMVPGKKFRLRNCNKRQAPLSGSI